MSRAQRLLALIQILRSHRFPVSGEHLASELGISLRTLYRDIATLQEQGANIVGEAGVGYVLQAGFTLPPLMFTEDELEAIVLGSRWVANRADERLGDSAASALAKIASVLPTPLRRELDDSGLLIGPARPPHQEQIDLQAIRQCIRQQSKLLIHYSDQHDAPSQRIVWPFALGYFEQFRIMVGWCELRDGYRHFRTDRITRQEVLQQTYSRPRQVMLREWRQQNHPQSQAITTDRN
ncbi:helix-turn-helix transcriptional regulator [Granulosicoccus sp. 3-233]|uniref:helix-turn-helix transcriptional regulator n=1 Tax=Granulosicoccus sp. 3-233 TaxID=3417969 RepID=UPI003D338669